MVRSNARAGAAADRSALAAASKNAAFGVPKNRFVQPQIAFFMNGDYSEDRHCGTAALRPDMFQRKLNGFALVTRTRASAILAMESTNDGTIFNSWTMWF
jgi:hypothetical protein